MRRGWRRAGTSLILAGALGAGTSWASEPITIDHATGLPVFEPGKPVPQMVVVEAAKARAWIMQIELALMADPVTFPYVLRAQAGQDGMELRGYVPSAVIKEKALGMARQICPIKVVDYVEVETRMGAQLPPTPNPTLDDAVRQRLEQLSGEAANNVNVEIRTNGMVVVSGAATSLEEKLALSRSLRGLSGCAAVVNDMTTPEAAVATRPVLTPKVIEAPRAAKVTQAKSTEPPKAALAGVVMTDANETTTKAPSKPIENVQPGRASVTAAWGQRQPAATPNDHAIAQTSVASTANSPMPSTAASAMRNSQNAPNQRARDQLRAKIRAVLGTNAKDVDVVSDGKGGMKIIVFVTGTADPKAMGPQILQIPEVPSNVNIELRLD